MTIVQQDCYETLRIESNATLSTSDIDDDPHATIASSSYEYIEGAEDSPYIISSSVHK